MESSIQQFAVADYIILPVTFSALPSFPHTTTHNLYVRPHQPKIPTPEAGQSLFLSNIPFDTTAAHLRTLLTSPTLLSQATTTSSKPQIDKIHFPSLPTPKSKSQNPKKRKRSAAYTNAEGETARDDPLESPLPATFDYPLHPSGSAAIIVFKDRASFTRVHTAIRTYAASTPDERPPLPWPSQPLGSPRYRKHGLLSRPASSALSTLVESYMTRLASVEASLARARATALSQPDDDGFVTVGRPAGAAGGGWKEEQAREKLDAMRAKEAKKRAAMADFYRFQTRERRKEREREVRRGFEGQVERLRGDAARRAR